MDENRRLAIALAAPAILLAGGAVASIQPGNNPELQAEVKEAAESETMDPEVEKILHPYRVAKREKLAAEAEKILYPYRFEREDVAKTAEPASTADSGTVNEPVASEVTSVANASVEPQAVVEEGDVSDLEALLTSDN